MIKPIKLTAHHKHSCFCPVPEIPDSHRYETEPRWEFRQQVLEYCKAYGLENVQFNRVDKGATATLRHPCEHRTEQTYRID